MGVGTAAVPVGDGGPDGWHRARLEHIALAAISHPVSLGAIALLLLNDHFLKRAYPSILAGKLSDFAGLFFFPFLLAAAAGVATRGGLRRGANEAVMAACFAATALGFAVVKLHPAANAFAAGALEAVLGLPVRIVRDPSDLVALLALWPAWRLWKSVRPRRGPGSARSYLALAAASLAALATAPCPPQWPVLRVVAVGGEAYALTDLSRPSEGVYRSGDGVAWDWVKSSSLPVEVTAAQAVDLPRVVCVPGQEDTCYRAAGEERLEASGDGGVTWRPVWGAAAARRSFMQRIAGGYGQMLACGKDLDLRATDVAVLGSGADHLAIVALGNEGVLLGRSGGAWTRAAVGTARPTPETGSMPDLLPPSLIIGETVAAVLAAATALLVFSYLAWKRYRPDEAHDPPKRNDTPWKTGVIVTLLVFILMFALDIEALVPYAVVPLVGFVAWVVVLWSGWLRTLRGSNEAGRVWGAFGLCVLGSVLVGLVVWIPFALWVLGTISTYPAALLLAVTAVVGVALVFRRVLQGRSAPSSAA